MSQFGPSSHKTAFLSDRLSGPKDEKALSDHWVSSHVQKPAESPLTFFHRSFFLKAFNRLCLVPNYQHTLVRANTDIPVS